MTARKKCGWLVGVGQVFQPASGEAFQLRRIKPLDECGNWKVPGSGRHECLPYKQKSTMTLKLTADRMNVGAWMI
jgi:hypothetical protein